MIAIRHVALLGIFALVACASHSPKQGFGIADTKSAGKASELALEQQRLHDIIVSRSKHYGQGLAELRDVIAASAFNSLSVDDQFQALTLAANSTSSPADALARGYLDRAIALPGIGFEDLLTTLRMAVNAGYGPAAAKSLVLLARRWPDRIASVDNRFISQTLWLNDHGARDQKFLILQSLYATHWKLEWGIEPSEYWLDLALFLVEKRALDQAIDVSTHITAPYALIGMRTDRRFDAVVSAHPDQFDVELAADRELKTFQSLSDEHPKSLSLKARVMEALQHKEHYAAMLAASDSAVQEIRATNFPEKLYDDYVQEHDGYFDLRSIALEREGRWEEAEVQMIAAARDGSIDQIINLAYLYCALDRPKDALAVLGPVGPTRTSPYGAMQAEVLRLQSAVQLEDRDRISSSMQYLRSHQADAPRTYLYGLIVANQLNQATHYLIKELEDTELRQSVLPEIQEYLPTPGTKTELEMEARWQSVIARKEVQAIVHKIGRIASYHLEAP